MMTKMFHHDSANEKDLSKIFSFLRNQLELKEKELIELQRKDPSLSGPDQEQISILLNNIESLHLSTEDGSFLVTFNDHSEDNAVSSIEPTPTGIQAIKDLPLSIWICQTDEKKTIITDRKTSIFHHLLSLPLKNFLASSSDNTREKESMFDHLLSLPLHNYLASSSSQSSKQRRILNNNTAISKRWSKSFRLGNILSRILDKKSSTSNTVHMLIVSC